MGNEVNVSIISNYISQNHLTIRKFCEECKISVSTYYKIMQGKDVKLIYLFRIAKYMNLDIWQLFE